ncbi:MAG: hypothetical protein L0387_44120, partial [Acidobacteria bacterium]|nr:hypothetical protein [Acidobacteriota bacterium]
PLDGSNTYLAGLGFIGYAIYNLSTGDITGAVNAFLAGWAILAGRRAVAKVESVTSTWKEWL